MTYRSPHQPDLIIRMLAACTAILIAAFAVWRPSVATAADEAALITVLKSDAGQFEKATACRELSRIASAQAVPALAALLTDAQLAHMARYALETIPDPAASQALRDSLAKVDGRLLIGVMGSLGVRRDADAVEPLARRLSSAEQDVAQAAARALGQIGTVAAADALQAALNQAPAAIQPALCEGLFRCAETLAAEGQAGVSLAIFDRLRTLTTAARPIRVAALRGAILGRQNEGIALLLEALRGTDRPLTAAAVRTAMEMPGGQVTAALAAELPKLPADKQQLIIGALGQRGDAAAGPALLDIAIHGEPAVRLAAIRNLTRLGDANALSLLAELALSDQPELASAARESLGSFPGRDADAVIFGMLGHRDARVRGLAVEMIGLRTAAGAMAALFKAAADADETVRLAALRTLRDQAGPAELAALLKILVAARSPAETQAAEAALAGLVARQTSPVRGDVVIVKAQYGDLPEGTSADVTAKVAAFVADGAMAVEATNGNFGDPIHGVAKKLRIDYTVDGVAASKTVGEGQTLTFTATATPPAIVEGIGAALPGASGEAKVGLFRLLRAAGGAPALTLVKAAAADGDVTVREGAMRVLCEWPTPDALPPLVGLVEASPSRTIQVLALRGVARLTPQQDAPAAQKLATLKNALERAERVEEKRLVLSAAGQIGTADSLALVASHLTDPTLKEEACLAAVMIAEQLGPGHNDVVNAALRQVVKATGNAKLAAKAQALADKRKP